jgi:hypothetical protein
VSSNADEELAEIERELRGKPTPHIEKPGERPITDGSMCFLNDRECNPECRAYDHSVIPAQGPEVCTLLSSVMDIADGIKPFIDVAQTLRKVRQDKQRAEAGTQPVPSPTGRKPT